MAVFKSTNDGAAWSRMFLSTEQGDVHAVALQPSNKNNILAGGWTIDPSYNQHSRMYRSTNGGSTWSQVGSAVFGTLYEQLNGICWDPMTPARVLAATSRGVYVSTDAGVTWSVPATMISANDIVADPTRPNNFYAASYNGVYVTTNAGTSWMAMNNGLNTLSVRRLTLDSVNRRLFAATDGDGVYRFSLLTDVPEIAGAGVLPPHFVLEQNYPNPFNPATTIEFSVPENGDYRLAVYNTLGQEVAVLVDGRLHAGHHRSVLDASGLASGPYLCRLSGNQGFLVRKLTFIR